MRKWGVGRSLYALLAEKVLRRVGLRIFVIHLRPHHGNAAPHGAGEAVELRVLGWQELEEHAREPELEMSPDFLAEARARGDLCAGALDAGRLVAYVWRAFAPAPAEDGMWVRFRKPHRYGYKAFTRPEYRGLHLQSALAPTTDALLEALGYTHAIGYVDLSNYPSRRSSERHGNQAIGYAGYWRLFGRAWAFESPGAKRHGFAFFDPARGAPTSTP